MVDVEEEEVQEIKSKRPTFPKPDDKARLAYKRSFFVRMVSDPKIYNPKIVKIKSAVENRSLTSTEPLGHAYDDVPTSPTM